MMLKNVGEELDLDLLATILPHDLTQGKFYVLGQLLQEEMLDHPAPRPSDLAESLAVTRATITGLLDGLERSGLVKRLRQAEDRRVLTVHMTDKARALLDQILPRLSASVSRLGGALSDGEKRALVEILGKLEQALKEIDR
ncbi:MAG: MarR family transcriptional regulator [Capsulimonadaceae bacterium]|nr:MarR family transcriptional regulator [Capsulimonadaceae bacterium]